MKSTHDGIPKDIAESPGYRLAISCTHCTNTCDSRNRYVSTYCHLRHEHLAGFRDSVPFPCQDCPDYAKK